MLSFEINEVIKTNKQANKREIITFSSQSDKQLMQSIYVLTAKFSINNEI